MDRLTPSGATDICAPGELLPGRGCRVSYVSVWLILLCRRFCAHFPRDGEAEAHKQHEPNLEKYKASVMPPEVGDREAAVASAGDQLQRPAAVGTAFPCGGRAGESDHRGSASPQEEEVEQAVTAASLSHPGSGPGLCATAAVTQGPGRQLQTAGQLPGSEELS